jgi:hypothetical protein
MRELWKNFRFGGIRNRIVPERRAEGDEERNTLRLV